MPLSSLSLCSAACKNQLTLSAQFVPFSCKKQQKNSCWVFPVGAAPPVKPEHASVAVFCLQPASRLSAPLQKNFSEQNKVLPLSAYCSPPQTALQQLWRTALHFYAVASDFALYLYYILYYTCFTDSPKSQCQNQYSGSKHSIIAIWNNSYIAKLSHPAFIGWVALSSIVRCSVVPHW